MSRYRRDQDEGQDDGKFKSQIFAQEKTKADDVLYSYQEIQE